MIFVLLLKPLNSLEIPGTTLFVASCYVNTTKFQAGQMRHNQDPSPPKGMGFTPVIRVDKTLHTATTQPINQSII